jgi:hypothetical protein
MLMDCLAGLLGGIIGGVLERLGNGLFHVDGSKVLPGYEDKIAEEDVFMLCVKYYIFVGLLSTVATMFELAMMYHVHLRMVIEVSLIGRLKLFPIDASRAYVISALARAALEMPDSTRRALGVDPLEGANPLRLFIYGLLYKMKRSASTFLIRLLVRRSLSRLTVKTLLPFAGAVVNMFWNAMVGYKCIRGARIIVLGTTLALQTIDHMIGRRCQVSTDTYVDRCTRPLASGTYVELCLIYHIMYYKIYGEGFGIDWSVTYLFTQTYIYMDILYIYRYIIYVYTRYRCTYNI